jgi:hypothetical protein
MTSVERHERIVRLREQGSSWREIAAELGLSVRQVRRIFTAATSDATGMPQGGNTASDATPAPPSEPFRESKAEFKAAETESKASGMPIRERMASDFEGLYDEIREKLGKATKLTKKIWLSCRHCNKRTLVDVPDVKSLLDTLTFLSDRGIGKPATAESEAAGAVWRFENRIFLSPRTMRWLAS